MIFHRALSSFVLFSLVTPSAFCFDCRDDLRVLAARTDLVLQIMNSGVSSDGEFASIYSRKLPNIMSREFDRVKGIKIFLPGPTIEGAHIEINSAYVMEAFAHPFANEVLGAAIDQKIYAAFHLLFQEYLKLYGGRPDSQEFLQTLHTIDTFLMSNSAFVVAIKGPTSANVQIPTEDVLGLLRLVRIHPKSFQEFKSRCPNGWTKGSTFKQRLYEMLFGVQEGRVIRPAFSHLPLEIRSGIELPRAENEIISEIGRLTIRKQFNRFIAARLFRELFLLAYQPWDGVFSTTFYLEADSAHVRLFRKFGFKVIDEIQLQSAVGEEFFLMKGNRSHLEKAIYLKESEFQMEGR